MSTRRRQHRQIAHHVEDLANTKFRIAILQIAISVARSADGRSIVWPLDVDGAFIVIESRREITTGEVHSIFFASAPRRAQGKSCPMCLPE